MKKIINYVPLILLLIAAISIATLIIKKISITDTSNTENNLTQTNLSQQSPAFSVYSNAIETTDNVEIKGNVESITEDYIFIFGGKHEGELGLQISEYTSAYLEKSNQNFIDYLTGEKHDINYIQEGDLLICTGTLIKRSTSYNTDYGFDTKENNIIVLKKSDLENIEKEAISNNLDNASLIKIHSVYPEYAYVQFNIDIPSNSNTTYTISFIERMSYSSSSNISDTLASNTIIKKIKLKNYNTNSLNDISITSAEF